MSADANPTPYQPSVEERDACARLIAAATPPRSAYDGCRAAVESYRGLVGPALRRRHSDIISLRMRRSSLFPGYEYLIAYEVAGEARPRCGAAAPLAVVLEPRRAAETPSRAERPGAVSPRRLPRP